MDGFKRPRRPTLKSSSSISRPAPGPTVPPVSGQKPESMAAVKSPEPVAVPVDNVDVSLSDQGRPILPAKPFFSRRRVILAIIIGLAVIVGLSALVWFKSQLAPVDGANKTPQRVEIKEGASFTYIAGRLKERGLIRSVVAFDAYARIVGKRSGVQAGTCSLTPAESSAEILNKLTSGCHDFLSITFFPGGTLVDSHYKPTHQDVTTQLLSLVRDPQTKQPVFTKEQVTAALQKTYPGPLFADKPANTSLEGYVYGQTYYVDPNATVEQILQKTFDQMYADIEQNGLIDKFKQHGLNLYQAITLASIIQKEVHSESDMRQVAQIFLDRYHSGGTLGSDVTFNYGAEQLGVAPSVNLNSPYNTRIHPGLPPGPISSPGIQALEAVANPASGNYLYFLAGDDGKTYFAKTQAEHEANIKNHCQTGCSQP